MQAKNARSVIKNYSLLGFALAGTLLQIAPAIL
jgi:hypothetical protein